MHSITNVLRLFYIFLLFQDVVEEIQEKTTELGKLQKSGHDLIEAISGKAFFPDWGWPDVNFAHLH